MSNKTTAKIARSSRSGQFTLRKSGGGASVHVANKRTPKTVSASISKNRDALKRLADR